MTERDLQIPSAKRLAEIIDLDPSLERTWRPQDLGAMLEHQLSAPLPVASAGEQVRSYSCLWELLNDPHPPLEVLTQVKEFAKASASQADSALPADVAKVIYYLLICVAVLRCDKRISSMSDKQLASSLRWAAKIEWVGPPLRAILNDALQRIGAAG